MVKINEKMKCCSLNKKVKKNDIFPKSTEKSMMYSSNELEEMKGTTVGNIINNIYKSNENNQLQVYYKHRYCGKYIFTK